MTSAGAPALQLELVQGPVQDQRLRAIASLYGAFNTRYADLGFCRRVFNESPGGSTLHAFVVQGTDQVVAHYALLPMRVATAGRFVSSAKGEAFVVHPEHRAATVAPPGRSPLQIGIAVPIALYDFAERQGIELVHMIADPEVGLIHRLAGCRPLEGPYPKLRLVLRASALAAPRGAWWKRGGQIALGTAQRAAFEIATVTLPARGRVRVRAVRDMTGELLERIAAELPPLPGWTLAIDQAALSWMIRVGDLRLVSLDEGMADYALVCPRSGDGRTLEVVLWRQSTAKLGPSLRLLGAIARLARAEACALVSCAHQAAWRSDERTVLRAAGRRLGFLDRVQPSNVYVRTSTPEFLEPRNLALTPFFHAVF